MIFALNLHTIIPVKFLVSSYPTEALITYVDHAHYTLSTSGNVNQNITNTETGLHLIAILGTMGGSGASDSLIIIGGVGTGNTYTTLTYNENSEYETYVYLLVDFTTIGTHTITYSVSGTIYRSAVIAWKLEAVDTNNFTTGKVQDLASASQVITPYEGGAVASVFMTRDGSPALGGLADVDVPYINYSSTFWYGAASESLLTSATDLTITNTLNGGTALRSLMGWISFNYLTELAAESFAVSYSSVISVHGPKDSAMSVTTGSIFALFGRKDTEMTIQNSTLYVIMEP